MFPSTRGSYEYSTRALCPAPFPLLFRPNPADCLLTRVTGRLTRCLFYVIAALGFRNRQVARRGARALRKRAGGCIFA